MGSFVRLISGLQHSWITLYDTISQDACYQGKKKSFLGKATMDKTPVLGGKLFAMVSEENKKLNIHYFDLRYFFLIYFMLF